MKWTLYILRCADDTLYTGITTDLDRRVEEHEQGKGARYTRGRGPFTVVHTEPFRTQNEAARREWEVKRMSRTEKMRLIGKGE